MNTIPELDALIEEYLEILRDDEDGLLNPYHRVRLYKEIQANLAISGASLILWLQVLTAQHVLPIARWFLPYDLKPERVLQTSIGFLNKTVSEIESNSVLDETLNFLADVKLEAAPPAIMRAFHVYEAAFAALDWCLIPLELPDFKKSDNEEDWMDPDSDAANWACAAYAGAVWDSDDDYDSEKGIKFWKWWLTEAVPQAWELATRNKKIG